MSRAGRVAFDLAAAGLIVSLLWIPVLSDFAGVVFSSELFFHWDHFVMAPALAWRHGMALGADVYSQYGVGWPLLLNALDAWIPLSHQNAIGLGVAYGCAFFVGLYGVMVLLSGSRAAALAGALLALWLSPFAPVVAERSVGVLWVWPSLTVLRAPMEVWFFLALLLHARGRAPAAAIAAGLCVGLALLLETDTGILLAATLAAYGVALSAARGRAALDGGAAWPASGAALAASWGVAAAVLLAGLAVSSRGALLGEPGVFLGAWLDGVRNSSGLGVGALDFNWFLVHHPGVLPWALVVLGSGLLAVAFGATRLLHGRLGPESLFASCVGLYAVARCMLFVWRTNPIRLTLAAVPLALLFVAALAALRRPAGDALRRRAGRELRALDDALPVGAALVASVLVLASPGFAAYPNVWHAAEAPPGLLALFPRRGEVTGLPTERAETLRAIRATIREVRTRAERGERVAVVDPLKTLIFLEADVRPWRGSPSWFANTWTHAEVERLAARLGPDGPDTVVLRHEPPSVHTAEIWATLREHVARHYVPARRIGLFEIWERRVGGATPDAPSPRPARPSA